MDWIKSGVWTMGSCLAVTTIILAHNSNTRTQGLCFWMGWMHKNMKFWTHRDSGCLYIKWGTCSLSINPTCLSMLYSILIAMPLILCYAAFSNRKWPLWLYQEWESYTGCSRKVRLFAWCTTAVESALSISEWTCLFLFSVSLLLMSFKLSVS